MPDKKKEINLSKYLSDPNSCPFCDSDNVAAGNDADFSDIKAWRNVRCNDCEEEWTEEFTITNVQVDTEDL